MPLDMLITGRIATLAGDTGFGWVEAIGIRDGRIAFAGTEVFLETRADPFTERIRLEPGQVAVPGLTDAHLHLVQSALATRQVDLEDAPTLEEGLARLRAAHERLPEGPGSRVTAGTAIDGVVGRPPTTSKPWRPAAVRRSGRMTTTRSGQATRRSARPTCPRAIPTVA